MDPAVQGALLMMAAALPTMFIVIGIFIVMTKALVSLFPYSEDEDDDD